MRERDCRPATEPRLKPHAHGSTSLNAGRDLALLSDDTLTDVTDTGQHRELEVESRILAQVKQLMTQVDCATNPAELKKIRAYLVGLEELATQLNRNSAVRYRLAEAKLISERKVGMMLSKMAIVGGQHLAPRLCDMHITPRQSRDWQILAKLTEDDLRQFVNSAMKQATNPSTRGAVRFARDLLAPPPSSHKGKGHENGRGARPNKKGKAEPFEVNSPPPATPSGIYPRKETEEGFDPIFESIRHANQALSLVQQLPMTLGPRYTELLPRLISEIIKHLSDLRERPTCDPTK